jgi:hypothetical protein
MNRLPDRQIDVDDPPRLGRIRRSGDGHVETLTALVGGDEAERLQKFLQVAHEAWSIDDDVQAAVGAPEFAATKSPSLTVVTKRRPSRPASMTSTINGNDRGAPFAGRLGHAFGTTSRSPREQVSLLLDVLSSPATAFATHMQPRHAHLSGVLQGRALKGTCRIPC